MLIARQKIRYLVILNENFLTQITTLLAPKNNQVLLRIGISPFGARYALFLMHNHLLLNSRH